MQGMPCACIISRHVALCAYVTGIVISTKCLDLRKDSKGYSLRTLVSYPSSNANIHAVVSLLSPIH